MGCHNQVEFGPEMPMFDQMFMLRKVMKGEVIDISNICNPPHYCFINFATIFDCYSGVLGCDDRRYEEIC